jgi:adenine deaminase
MEHLRAFRPNVVFKDGQVAARDGQYVGPSARHPLPDANTVHLPILSEVAFRLRLGQETVPVLHIQPGSLITRKELREVRVEEGVWTFDADRDVVLLASIERHRASGQIGLGLAAGFGFRKQGALASTVAHDSHNVITAGTNPRDMLVAVRALGEMGGGFVTVRDGAVQARLPLPFAGLLSKAPWESVEAGLGEVEAAAEELGISVPCPFGILSFLALSVIPEIRLTDQGFWDVLAQEFLPLG